jgi:phage terminase large subunit GpA-like protein
MIYPLFMRGDQRYYYVPCRHCNEMQVLTWHALREDKSAYGIIFDFDKAGHLIEDSVAYECQYCRELFHNYDKAWMLPRGEWRPHSTTEEPGLVSFHIDPLVSPVGMYDWTGIVYKWLKAWDIKNDRPRDLDQLRSFYNLERGLPWEERGESPKFERVQQHRRAIYAQGEVPNLFAIRETGAPVILLTCTVDVHGDRLDVEVVGWCCNRQSYSVEWLHFEGDIDNIGPQGPWQHLRTMIEAERWTADDGRVYRIELTLIDCGHKADTVHQFCTEYSSGVYPIMGRELPVKGSLFKEFNEFVSKFGTRGYNVTATIYKDRLAAWLRTDWEADQLQPLGYPNYPSDYGDDFFRQYEGEEKVEVVDKLTKVRKGFLWRQRGQRPNHAWDCRVYGMAALDMVVLEVCVNELEIEKIDYEAFAKYATPVKNSAQEWIPTRFSWIPGEQRTPPR